MPVTYGESNIPGTVLTARVSSTTAVSLAFESSVCLIGGYDDVNGNLSSSSYSAGELIDDVSEQQAENLFGEDSELHNQVRLAFLGGAGRVQCVPLPETSTTETFAAVSSGTLSDDPIDPRVNTEHSITAQDTVAAASVDVNLVDDDPPSTPSSSNTINLNPTTGDWEADESSDYDISYDYADWSTSITNAAPSDARFITALTENDSHLSTLLTDVKNEAQDFDFKRAVGGIPPQADPANYTIPFDDQRMVLTAPARGTALDQTVRLSGAIAGAMAGTELGGSATGDQLSGVTGVGVRYTKSDLTNFGSNSDLERITPVRRGPDGFEIVEDLTTSTTEKFQKVYKVEIVDDIAYACHLVARRFISEPNTVDSRELALEAPIRATLRDAADNSPPLLSSTDGSEPFAVTSSAGATDEEVDLDIGIDVTGVAKLINIDLGVGPILTFEGAS